MTGAQPQVRNGTSRSRSILGLTPRRLAFAGFLLLAVLHVPVLLIGQDAVGLFDLYVIGAALAVLMLRGDDLRLQVPAKLTPLLYTYAAFLFYATMFFAGNYLIAWDAFNLFSLALLLKQYEYLLIAMLTLYFLGRLRPRAFHRWVYVVVLIIALNGFYQMFVTGEWYRLGLINLIGAASANPAGFLLAASLLTLLILVADDQYNARINKAVWAVCFLVGYLALFLTFSRTNNLAFILCTLFFLVARFDAWRLLGRYIPVLGAVYVVVVLLIGHFDIGIYHLLPLEYLIDPRLILEDSSFTARFERAWWAGSAAWLSNPFHFFFGTGLGTVRVTDGLLPHLLYTTGVPGTVLYYSLLGILLVRFPLPVKTLTLFVLLNSIAVETTVLSFRTMQVFIILLLFVLYRYGVETGPADAGEPRSDAALASGAA